MWLAWHTSVLEIILEKMEGQLVVTAIDYRSTSIFSELVQIVCVHRKEFDKTMESVHISEN